MITDQGIDKALFELARTAVALKALRAVRKSNKVVDDDHHARRLLSPVVLPMAPFARESEVKEHSAVLRASMDLSRALSTLRKGDRPE
jgi:hypothetical protein